MSARKKFLLSKCLLSLPSVIILGLNGHLERFSPLFLVRFCVDHSPDSLEYAFGAVLETVVVLRVVVIVCKLEAVLVALRKDSIYIALGLSMQPEPNFFLLFRT